MVRPESSDPEYYLRERYAGGGQRSAALDAYYRLKPLLPRRMQLALRRIYAPRQARRAFPAWPAEDVLLRLEHAALRQELEDAGTDSLPVVGYWPDGHRTAVIVTHDVEGPAGLARIRPALELERRCGIVSSWNLCGDWYPIPDDTLDLIRDAGCEVGLHGMRHDGRLFSSREAFEQELPKIHETLAALGAVGFRSPATHRNAEWMHELGCLYDSSFPDTDPFEPQGGGCCSILPYFFGDVVELPITLVQDHTLWEILGRDDIDLWIDKALWIAARHGLVNVIVHPDYLDRPSRWRAYEELLAWLSDLDGAWHALPRDVASWWRERASLDVTAARRHPRAVVWRARADGDGVAFDIPAAASA